MTTRDTITSASTPPVSGNTYVDNVDGHLKRLLDKIHLPISGISGTNTLTGGIDPDFDADGYVSGMTFSGKWPTTNTSTTVTLNLDSEGAITVLEFDGSAPAIGSLVSGEFFTVEYDGTNFLIISPSMDLIEATVSPGVLAQVNPGALAFIETIDLSGDATADFTGFDSAEYDGYMFLLGNVVPTSDAARLWMRTSTDGGSNYDAASANYYSNYMGWTPATTTSLSGQGTTSDTKMVLSAQMGSAAGEDGVSGRIMVFFPHLSRNTFVESTLLGNGASSAADFEWNLGFGVRDSSADVDAVRFMFSAGNLESGTITMYGFKNA